MRRQVGFTLLELMIVVVVISILSALAISSYRSYAVRTHRTDAQRTLIDLAGRQERFFYSHNVYTSTLADLSGTSTMVGNGEYYTISIPSASSTDYTITATAVGNQQRDDALCQTLSLERSGTQSSTGSTANDPKCWGN